VNKFVCLIKLIVYLQYNKQLKTKIMTKIKTLTTRFATDYNCILTADLLEVKGNFATILFQGKVIKKKIKTSFDGSQYILPLGSYSMAPSFTL